MSVSFPFRRLSAADSGTLSGGNASRSRKRSRKSAGGKRQLAGNAVTSSNSLQHKLGTHTLQRQNRVEQRCRPLFGASRRKNVEDVQPRLEDLSSESKDRGRQPGKTAKPVMSLPLRGRFITGSRFVVHEIEGGGL